MSSSASKPVILVVGASGNQGNAVANALLENGSYKVRAASRNPANEKIQALVARGAEAVAMDFTDEASMNAALSGCYGAFLVTNFWELFGSGMTAAEAGNAELQQTVKFMDAAKAAGVTHLVYSGLYSCKDRSNGQVHVPHFDGKGEAEKHLISLQFPRFTILELAAFYENFLTAMAPRDDGAGNLTLALPTGETSVPFVSVADIGPVACKAFCEPDSLNGRTLPLAGDDQPMSGYCDILATLLGRPVRFQPVPVPVFKSFGFPGAEELADMFDCHTRFGSPWDVAATRQAYPTAKTFEQWAREMDQAGKWNHLKH